MSGSRNGVRRVLVLLSEVFANGGIQRFNRTLLTAIEKIGCDCDVLSLADTEQSRGRWLPVDSPLRVRTFARQKATFAAAALRAIASGTYDDVIIGHVHFLDLAVSARVFRRRPRLFVVAHGVEVWDRVSASWRRSLASIDHILCVSEYTACSIRRQAPAIPADRYAIFPNALADSWVEKMGALATVGAGVRGAPFLLAVARLSHFDRTKGIITALEAFAQLARPGLEFVIAGDGDDLQFLRQVVARLGVADRVRFVGAVSDAELVALYRDCAAFVLPSGQEGFGIVFLEAMFFGAPVVAAAEKGALDVMRDGHTGLLVPYGDVVSLGTAIARVLDDAPLRARLISAARANVTGDGCFTAAAFERRLAALLGAAPRPRRVVFVNRYFHPDESATSRMVSDLARRLARAGERVSVVTSRQLYHDAAADLAPEDTVDGVAIHRVSRARRGRGRLAGRALDYLSFHVAAGWRLLRLLRPGDIVVAKTDPPLLSVTVALVARMRGAVLVNWLQDLFPEVANELGMDVRPRWLARFLRRRRDASLRRAACNVAIGTRMAERVEQAGVDRAAIRVIPNWADVADIVPRQRSGNPVRGALGLNDDHFVIGYSGNLGRAHEYETLLDAAQRLADRPEFVFVMTGAGAKFDAMRRAAQTRHLTNVRFQPFQPPERLAESMAAADVHVVSLLPTLEGLIVPSKFYGILAAARPAVFIGDIDGELARAVRSLDCGVAVAVGDGTALAAQCVAWRAQPERLMQLGANARRAAEEQFSSERALVAWQTLLATLGVVTQPPALGSALVLKPRVQSGT